MNQVSRLLRDQREAERRFAADAASDQSPKGWSAALTFFHMARWRQRLLDALTAHSEGRSYAAPSGDIDEFNDAELPEGANVSLAVAAEQSDATLGSLIEMWENLGNHPFKWFTAENTSEALVRNSYLHPRIHIASYLMERGDQERGDQMVEETAANLRGANAPARMCSERRCTTWPASACHKPGSMKRSTCLRRRLRCVRTSKPSRSKTKRSMRSATPLDSDRSRSSA